MRVIQLLWRIFFPPNSWPWVLLGLMLGGMFLTVMPRMGYGLLAFSLYFVLSPFVSLIHELGHLLMGWLSGLKLVFIQLRMLRLTRTQGGFKWQIHEDQEAWGGLTSMHPVSTRHLRLRFVAFASGGFLAEMALGVLAFWGWRIHGAQLDAEAGMIHFLYGLELAVLVHVGVHNLYALVPRRLNGLANDSMSILAMIVPNRDRQMTLAYMDYMARTYAGIRPREIPMDVFAKVDPSKLSAESLFFYHFLGYAFCIDRGDLAAARLHLGGLWEQFLLVNEEAKGFVRMLNHWHLVAKEDWPVFDEAWTAGWREHPDNGCLHAYFRAQVCHAHGDHAGALRELAEAERLLLGLQERGWALVYLESVEALRAKLVA